MVLCRVIKGCAQIGHVTYFLGDDVDLPADRAETLRDWGIVVYAVEERVPTISDEVFAEQDKKLKETEKLLETANKTIDSLKKQLTEKDLMIASLKAKK